MDQKNPFIVGFSYLAFNNEQSLHQNIPFCVILVLFMKNVRTAFSKGFKHIVFRTLTVRHEKHSLYMAYNMHIFQL
jgi:hypothetical protein